MLSNQRSLILKTRQLSDASAESIISVRALVKNYTLGQTTVYAVRGVDIDIKDGEFVAIVGNSGAGKTTLLNCMAGLDDPDYGVVFFKGKDLHSLNDKEKSKVRLLDMGFIFQNYALLPHFNARENVALPADIAGFSKDLRDRVEELLYNRLYFFNWYFFLYHFAEVFFMSRMRLSFRQNMTPE
jgi:ABC-type lipoprotein export system ATPase subunit